MGRTTRLSDEILDSAQTLYDTSNLHWQEIADDMQISYAYLRKSRSMRKHEVSALTGNVTEDVTEEEVTKSLDKVLTPDSPIRGWLPDADENQTRFELSELTLEERSARAHIKGLDAQIKSMTTQIENLTRMVTEHIAIPDEPTVAERIMEIMGERKAKLFSHPEIEATTLGMITGRPIRSIRDALVRLERSGRVEREAGPGRATMWKTTASGN